MIYGYARVSTNSQEIALEKQKKILTDSGAAEIYTDIRGNKKPSWYKRLFIFLFKLKKHTNLDKLIEVVKIGDIVIVTSVDRISRNPNECYRAGRDIINKGAAINILDLGTFDNLKKWHSEMNIIVEYGKKARKCK